MPFAKLTDEQILALLRARPSLEGIPGVMLFWVDLVGPTRSDPAVVVYLDRSKREEISRLPLSIAGVPVIARVEDRSTALVVETIDPRAHGGAWPHHEKADDGALCRRQLTRAEKM